MKRTTMNRRILAFLFCIAVILTGMYTPNAGIDSLFSNLDTAASMSLASRLVHRMDTTDEIFGSVTGEVPGYTVLGVRGSLSYSKGSVTNFYLTAVLPFIPFLVWIIIRILLRNRFINRMYLIRFIHNSDGKKRELAVNLMA